MGGISHGVGGLFLLVGEMLQVLGGITPFAVELNFQWGDFRKLRGDSNRLVERFSV